MFVSLAGEQINKILSPEALVVISTRRSNMNSHLNWNVVKDEDKNASDWDRCRDSSFHENYNVLFVCFISVTSLKDIYRKSCMHASATTKNFPCNERFQLTLTDPRINVGRDTWFCILQSFYRAMHFSAKRGIAIACRLSVRPSVCLSVCL